ncbi:gliding motility ABC transporter auxiliary component-like protein [Pseudomonas fluorescens]|uniref:Gliding motility ABC transporter auxiliary component-like protein n=2 Tax=Pseudomonas fluorescens TaxID=294 RepID=A0A379IBE2_PSEFL|nr:Gldg family protein [Pseudomonas fluorescens]SUD30197.1 gliding motility ABC transporter auxiliary component-like protein [Pseudomonas fluorescens]
MNLGVTLIVIALLFLAFNLVWVLKVPNYRLDLSDDKIHTLSPSTEALLATLEVPMDLYFFNSSQPRKSEALNRHGEYIAMLLKAYESAAKGNITLHLIDPRPFSEDEYKAEVLGLDSRHGLFGLIGTRANQEPQKIQRFDPTRARFLEYEISRLIHNVARQEQPTIGLISGLPMEGSRDDRNQEIAPPWQLLKEIRSQFNLMSLGSDIPSIPEHVKTLMVVQPALLPERTFFAIDQFVLGGGKLMMFIDPLNEPNSAAGTSNQKNLLAAWGLQMPANKVLTDSLFATPVVLTNNQLPVRHPGALTLTKAAMAQNDISSWNIDSVTLLNPGTLIPLKNSRTSFIPLLRSSAQASTFDGQRFAQPATFDAMLQEATTHGSSQVIAARLEGSAYSAFPDGINGQKAPLQKATNIHVVVVADTDLLSDRVWLATRNADRQKMPRSDNARFVLNTLDNLAAPPPLSAISPSTHERQPSGLLDTLRKDAAQAYAKKAVLLEQRLEQAEKEWQLLNTLSSLPSEASASNKILQALNKERLRLRMELHTLKKEAYRNVRKIERSVSLLTIVSMPLLVSLLGLWIFIGRRRHQHPPAAAFY